MDLHLHSSMVHINIPHYLFVRWYFVHTVILGNCIIICIIIIYNQDIIYNLLQELYYCPIATITQSAKSCAQGQWLQYQSHFLFSFICALNAKGLSQI